MANKPGSSNQSSRAFGRWGETRAAAEMRAAGYTIVDRNWRSPVRELPGELDIVARCDDTLVFCEVKARRSGSFGGGAGAVDERKQQQVRALAALWLGINGDDGDDVRFDVIAINGVKLTWIEAAF